MSDVKAIKTSKQRLQWFLIISEQKSEMQWFLQWFLIMISDQPMERSFQCNNKFCWPRWQPRSGHECIENFPDHNDVINVHELWQIVRGQKNKKAVGNDGIPSKVYKFASEQLLIMMLISLSRCMIPGMLPSTLMRVVIISLLKCKSKDPADVNNSRPIIIATALSKVREQVLLLRLARYMWTADSQVGVKQAQGTEIPTLHSSRNSHICFLDAKKAFDWVNHWTL